MSDSRYPPERGIWTLRSPTGKLWHGESPLEVVALEARGRIPPEVMLDRISNGLNEQQIAHDVWSKIWNKIKGKE